MCSVEEIEFKRRQAQEKLAQKRLSSPLKAAPSPTKRFSFSSPRQQKPYAKAAATDATKFYGTDKVVTGKCSLLSEDRFVVEMSAFSGPVIEIFKTMPTRNYNPATRNWDFHIKDHKDLCGKLQSLNPKVIIEKLPNFVINCLEQRKICDSSNADLGKIEPVLLNALMPFQQEGVRYGVEKNGRCLIADEMGLGKTFQALAIADYYREDWPLLIVTTSSVKNVWEQTIREYLPNVPVMQTQYMITAKDYVGESRILIVSHDMMSRACDALLKRHYGVLIIDESHTIKNFKAKCTKAATSLARRAKRVVLLSGTPALSKPSELFTQLSLIDDRFFGNFFDFSRRYCDGKQTNFGWDASGKSNLKELEIVLQRRFMIRRTKDEVLKQLPAKTQEVAMLDVDFKQFSEEDRNCLHDLAVKYENQKSSAKHKILLSFYSESAKIKIPSVCSYILKVLQARKKFIVFAHHQIMLDAICEVLNTKAVKFIRIDGNTTSEDRKHFVDKFQTNPEFLVAVLSITAANSGLTLTAADLVLFAELHWNPSILSQAESRAHRIGQVNPVKVTYLLAEGTVDSSIWPMLAKKQETLKETGLGESFNVANVEKANVQLGRTSANTLDIETYFKKEGDVFDDGLDEIMCDVEI